VNPPAIVGLALVGIVAYSGIKNVSRTNAFLTSIKLFAIFFFILSGIFHIKPVY